MNGCVSVGGMKIDDSVSYCAAACWACIIDNEIQSHVNSLSLYSNGGHSKRSAKLVMLQGRDGISIQQNISNFAVQFVDTVGSDIHKLSTGYPQPKTP
jgi:hypothetical protein